MFVGGKVFLYLRSFSICWSLLGSFRCSWVFLSDNNNNKHIWNIWQFLIFPRMFNFIKLTYQFKTFFKNYWRQQPRNKTGIRSNKPNIEEPYSRSSFKYIYIINTNYVYIITINKYLYFYSKLTKYIYDNIFKNIILLPWHVAPVQSSQHPNILTSKPCK